MNESYIHGPSVESEAVFVACPAIHASLSCTHGPPLRLRHYQQFAVQDRGGYSAGLDYRATII